MRVFGVFNIQETRSFSAINANKLAVTFSAPVTDTSKAVFSVKRGTVAEDVKAATWNDDKTVATLEKTSGNFIAGDYTVTVSGLDLEAGKDTATTTVAAETVQSIEIANNALQKSATAPLTIKFTNQYGTESTISASDAKLTITAFDTTANATINQVVGKFQLNAAGATLKDQVVVTVMYGSVKATKTLEVVNTATVSSVTLGAAQLPTGKTMFTPTGTKNVEVTYTAKNTLNEDCKLVTGDVGNGVIFKSSDETILPAANVSVDANNKIIISAFLKAGTVKLTALCPASGESSNIDITINEDTSAPYSITLEKIQHRLLPEL